MANAFQGGDPYLSLSDTLAKVATASTRPALWNSIKSFAGRFGYSHLTAVRARDASARKLTATLYADEPLLSLTAMGRRDPTEGNALLRRCRQSEDTFKLSELWNAPHDMDRPWIEAMPAELTASDALVAPVLNGSSLDAAFVFAGTYSEFSPRARLMLQLVAYAVYVRADRVGRHDSVKVPKPRFTEREMQCMRWLVVGKNDYEIASLLALKPRTVRFHADNIKMKFGVTTRAQVVARAVTDKLVVI